MKIRPCGSRAVPCG